MPQPADAERSFHVKECSKHEEKTCVACKDMDSGDRQDHP